MRLLSLKKWYLLLRCCIIILIITAASCITYGQSRYGLVVSGSKHVNGATIKNLNSRNFTISNANGEFALNLNVGDTVLTSCIGFKTDTLIFNNQSLLLVTLNPMFNLLNEVTIKGNKIDPLQKKRRNQEEYKEIYRIGDDKHIFSVIGGLGVGGLAISIDKLYSALSREGKNARRLQKTFIRDYQADVVDTRFTESLVAQVTGYTGQQLDNFMIENRPTYQFIKSASDYDIIQYIKSSNKNASLKDAKLAQ